MTKEDRSVIFLQQKRLNCISVANLDANKKKNFISSSLFRRENPLFSGKLKYLIGTLRQSFPPGVFTLLFCLISAKLCAKNFSWSVEQCEATLQLYTSASEEKSYRIDTDDQKDQKF
jgi:hypothetical protein